MRDHIGEVIKDIRKDKNVKMYQLADAIGISHGEMSKIENAKKHVNDERLAKISKVLKVDVFKAFMEDK